MKLASLCEAPTLRRNRAADVAALHAMQQTTVERIDPRQLHARPLKPPVYHFGPPRSNPAGREARKDRKRGIA